MYWKIKPCRYYKDETQTKGKKSVQNYLWMEYSFNELISIIEPVKQAMDIWNKEKVGCNQERVTLLGISKIQSNCTTYKSELILLEDICGSLVVCLEFELWFPYSHSSLKNVMNVISFVSIFKAQCIWSLPSSYLANVFLLLKIPFITEPYAWRAPIFLGHLCYHSSIRFIKL